MKKESTGKKAFGMHGTIADTFLDDDDEDDDVT